MIVGGGPAGAALAIRFARARAPHLLIERTRETGDALCGGFLSWRTLAALEGLGVEPIALGGAAIDRVRIFAGARMAEARLPGGAIGVSRHRLDSVLLARAMAEGARIERGAGARSVADSEVTLDDGASLVAEVLFLATGKYELRGLARPRTAAGSDPAMGLRVRLTAGPALHRLVAGAIELHAFDGGYAGLNLQEDGSGNLCMAVRKSRVVEAGGPEGLLAALGADSTRLGERIALRGGPIDAIGHVPYGWIARESGPGIFRLGDQAGVIPSLAGEGMGIALATARRAASAHLRGDTADAYQRAMARTMSRPIGVAAAILAAAERPWPAALLTRAAGKSPALARLAARLTRIDG